MQMMVQITELHRQYKQLEQLAGPAPQERLQLTPPTQRRKPRSRFELERLGAALLHWQLDQTAEVPPNLHFHPDQLQQLAPPAAQPPSSLVSAVQPLERQLYLPAQAEQR